MKKILIISIILLVGAAGIGLYLYNKPHKNMQRQKADFELEAAELYRAFEENETGANEKYLDKVIEVEGSIKEIVEENGKKSIILHSDSALGGVICELDDFSEHEPVELNEGDQIRLRGICTGMLMDVVLVRCIVIS